MRFARFVKCCGISLMVGATVTGCSAQRHGSATVPSAELQFVAPFGDSQAQLLAMADQARAVGKQPIYVTVKAVSRAYYFPVYAQVLQTTDLLLVRGYGRVYVYPKSTAQVSFGTNPVALSELPTAAVPGLEKIAAANTPGNFTSGTIKHKKFLCPDCTAVLGYLRNVRKVSTALNGKLDPWQVSPSYVPFTPKAPVANAVSLARHAQSYGSTSCWGGDPGFYGGGNHDFGGSANCNPSGLSYSTIYIYIPSCHCNSLLSSARKVQAEAQAASRSAEAFAKLQSAIAAHTVSDAQIESNIDAGITGRMRDLARAAMQQLPQYARQHVSGTAADGTFFSNRTEDLAAHARDAKWSQISGDVWKKPNGEIVTVPDIWSQEKAAAATQRGTQTVSCPPPGSSDTGGYVRGFLCNSSSGVYSAFVDASQVYGDAGNSWCFSFGDTGYLLVGAWSNTSNDTAEGGLQWSPTNKNYAMFVTDARGGIQDIPSSNSFPPGPFTMWFTVNASNWSLTVAGPGATRTWTYTKASAIQGGSSWTYKQGTFIAQTKGLFYPTDGSFFGVDAGSGLPLFTWSSAPGHDYFPDFTRGIRIGNVYGVNLHS
jgi:hypothetical protein